MNQKLKDELSQLKIKYNKKREEIINKYKSTIIVKPRGRPRIEKVEKVEVIKKPRGRPRIEKVEKVEVIKKPRGRPRIEKVEKIEVIKKQRGRPRVEKVEKIEVVKQARGRPKKNEKLPLLQKAKEQLKTNIIEMHDKVIELNEKKQTNKIIEETKEIKNEIIEAKDTLQGMREIEIKEINKLLSEMLDKVVELNEEKQTKIIKEEKKELETEIEELTEYLEREFTINDYFDMIEDEYLITRDKPTDSTLLGFIITLFKEFPFARMNQGKYEVFANDSRAQGWRLYNADATVDAIIYAFDLFNVDKDYKKYEKENPDVSDAKLIKYEEKLKQTYDKAKYDITMKFIKKLPKVNEPHANKPLLKESEFTKTL